VELAGATLTRRAKLRARLGEAGVGTMLVTRPPNVRYLTGFTGSYAALLLREDADVLLTDRRYDQQAASEVEGAAVVLAPGDLIAKVIDLLPSGVRLGFEPAGLTWLNGQRLLDALPRAVPLPDLVEQQRVVKDDGELASMAAAARAATGALAEVLPELRPGVTERQVAFELELAMRRRGADGNAFDPIIAFGEQAAEPHHRPGDRALRRGDVIKLDFGAVVDGYRSDMTRTLVLGPATTRQRELYEVVLAAQVAGLATLRPGVTGEEVDAACRAVVTAAGLGDHFTHPTGHGVGLEIHEAPRVRAGAGDSIAPGTPLTVEPGVYVPGYGGIRIEDLAVVRPDGPELLTTAPKELLVL
jgi:Xaa-Pro aminopeptidase